MPRKLPANGAAQLENKLEQLHVNGQNMGRESYLEFQKLDYFKELETEKEQLTDEITKMFRNR